MARHERQVLLGLPLFFLSVSLAFCPKACAFSLLQDLQTNTHTRILSGVRLSLSPFFYIPYSRTLSFLFPVLSLSL